MDSRQDRQDAKKNQRFGFNLFTLRILKSESLVLLGGLGDLGERIPSLLFINRTRD
jgi:hypothetical protein